MSEPSEHLQRLEAALAASGDIVYDWDLIADTLTWIGPAQSLFDGDIRTGQAFKERVHSEDLGVRMEAISRADSPGAPFDCEYRVRGSGGKFIWVHDRGTTHWIEGRAVRVIGVMRVITARKQREAELEYLANYDPLTGHFNRSRLREALDHTLAGSARYRTPGAYLVVGIDKLGAINEAYGSDTADAIVLGIGRRLDRVLRASDVIGRLGGDRFGIVLAQCPAESVALAAEKILGAIRDAPFETPHGPVHATVSVGGVPFVGGTLGAHEIMSRGESALQAAKQAGRNCYMPFSDSGIARGTSRRSLAIAEEVQAALKSARILFAFQPVVEAATHVVDHYECLLRMRRHDGTLVPASAFVPVAEQSGLMRLVDRHALDLAIAELDRYPDVRLALNISGLTAVDRGWLRALIAAVKRRPDVAERLIIEITETVALQDIEETARFVGAIRDLGCRVALDDFGAGYTSFRNLKALAVDCVKIDGSFVRGLADNVDNQLFIRTLLGLAEGFGLATVAECVETAADAVHLTRRGVRFLQGHYFGWPTIERPWLARQTPRFSLVNGNGAALSPRPPT
ncbi:MAG TPA: EAL domain-containing protein [Alphaproteobacteria bacterium]